MKICQEEIFGPVMSVIKFKDEAEVRCGLSLTLLLLRIVSYSRFKCRHVTDALQAIHRANSTVYGLGAGVCTRDVARVCSELLFGSWCLTFS